MLDTERINLLYNNVLHYDICRYGISENAIQNGIEIMQSVYTKENSSLNSAQLNLADYNDPAHRIAYLHKYAALHTAMVRDILYTASRMNFNFFHELIFSSNRFTICSLGGGPGSDVVGVLAALHQVFSYFPTSVTIVDYMTNWRVSFNSILQELGNGLYGAFGNNASHFLDWSYIGADLLQNILSPDVQDALANSSLVTMIKFASAAACIDTANMIDNIFLHMKPGAVLFFIDNDAGGYHELIMDGARKNNFLSIFGPIRHENYYNDAVRVKRFGYVSCSKTIVTVHILQKPMYFDHYTNPLVSSRSPLLQRVVLLENTNSPRFQTPYSQTLLPYTPQLTPDQLLGHFDYTKDERIDSNNFVSPSVEIYQSPKSVKKGKLGCLPLKRWRNNLAKKVNIVKSSLLRRKKKKVKKTHPVFRL